jgi:hypothetical protein
MSLRLRCLAAFWLKRMGRQINAHNLSLKRSHAAVRAKRDSGQLAGPEIALLLQRKNQIFAS